MKLNSFVKAGTQEYFYLLALWTLTKNNIGKIGHDNGFIDGYKFVRWCKINVFEGNTYLHEEKISKDSADFTRTFKVVGVDSLTPSFMFVSNWEH